MPKQPVDLPPKPSAQSADSQSRLHSQATAREKVIFGSRNLQKLRCPRAIDRGRRQRKLGRTTPRED